MQDNQNQPEKEMTPQEIEERKSTMMAFWTAQKTFLEAQASHQRLVTEIDELQTRSMMARLQLANLMAPPTPEEQEEQPAKPDKKLKKEAQAKSITADPNVTIA